MQAASAELSMRNITILKLSDAKLAHSRLLKSRRRLHSWYSSWLRQTDHEGLMNIMEPLPRLSTGRIRTISQSKQSLGQAALSKLATTQQPVSQCRLDTMLMSMTLIKTQAQLALAQLALAQAAHPTLLQILASMSSKQTQTLHSMVHLFNHLTLLLIQMLRKLLSLRPTVSRLP